VLDEPTRDERAQIANVVAEDDRRSGLVHRREFELAPADVAAIEGVVSRR
jgi:hypothetical protein